MKKYFFSVLLFFPAVAFAAGTLEVSSQPYHHRVLSRNAVNVPFLSIQATARDADVYVSQIHVKLTGLNETSDISSVRAISDYRRSLRGSFHNEGIAYLRYIRPILIREGETREFQIVGNMNASAFSGRTIGMQLEEIQSSADVMTSGSRVQEQVPSEISSYDTSSIDFSPLGSGGTIYPGRRQRVGRFRLQNKGKKDVILRRLSLKNTGTADLNEMFGSLNLYGKNGSRAARISRLGAKNVSFVFSQGYILKRGQSEVFSIWGNVEYGKVGETVTFTLNEGSDLVAEEARTYSRGRKTREMGYSSSASGSSTRSSLPSHSFDTGRLRISRNSYRRTRPRARTDLWNRNYSPGERNVVFLDTYVSPKGAVHIEELLAFVSSSSRSSDKDGNGITNEISDFEDSFGEFQLYLNGVYQDRADSFEGTTGNMYLEFDANTDIRRSVRVQITGRIKSTGNSGDRLKLTIDRNRSFPDKESIR